MIHITATPEWKSAHPGAVIGLLELSGVQNSTPSQLLNERKRQTVSRLRETYAGFARKEFLTLPVMAAYDRYYSRFDKTYHVQLQLESIVLKGRNLPDVSPLVDSNFLAEVDTLVLTAGHDADRLLEPVVIDVSRPGDQITQLGGANKPIRAGDMVMRDSDGISCSILYGQDNRSPISVETRHVLYVAYVPPGVPLGAVEKQMSQVQQYISLFSPTGTLEQLRFLQA